MRRSLPPLALGLVLLACASDPAATTPPGTTTPNVVCEEGERAAGDVCAPIFPEQETPCPTGTRVELGSPTCVAVGPGACPEGFAPHTSGWGCRPVVPETACTGPSRDALGERTCVPLGSCSAAAPPEATIFVDASFTTVDATHVKTIGEALVAATDGATIAIAKGTYPENLTIRKNVTIVGRCAGEVIVEGATDRPTAAIDAGAVVTLRGLAIRGGRRGVTIAGPRAVVNLDAMLFEGNQEAAISAVELAAVKGKNVVVRGTLPTGPSAITNGVFTDVEGTVTLEDSAIVGAADAAVGATGGGIVTLRRTVVRDTIPRPDKVGGVGARAFEEGRVELVESTIMRSRGTAIIAGRTKGTMSVVRSSIVDTTIDNRPTYETGNAVAINDSARLEMKASTVADNVAAGVFVGKGGASAKIENSAIVATRAEGQTAGGLGVGVAENATVEVLDTVVHGSALVAMQASGKDAKLAVTRCLVADTRGSSNTSKRVPAGRGGTAVVSIRGASVDVTSSTLVGSREVSAAAGNAGSRLSLTKTFVTNTMPNAAGEFGHGVMALAGTSVTVTRSVVASSAGVAVVFANGNGVVSRSLIFNNAIGIYAEQGSTLVESAEIPAVLEPGAVFVTPDTRFEGNQTKVGSGEIPLPSIEAAF